MARVLAVSWQVLHADCIEAMREMDEASVDAVVTDPPYNLSDSGKRDADCLRRVLLDVGFPHDQERDTEVAEGDDLALPSGGSPSLRWEDGAVRVDAEVGVPEGPVDLKRSAIREQEVNDGNVATLAPANGDLPVEGNVEGREMLGHYVLKPADGGDAPFCDATCGCFTEPRAGVIALDVAATGSAGRHLASGDLGGSRASGADVGGRDDAGGQAERTAGVVAGAGAVVRAVLRLDLRGGAHELIAADGAAQHRPLFLLEPSQPIGARTGARSPQTSSKSQRVHVVGAQADGTLALDAPWHALKPSRATGGFMGRKWDGWESPAAFQRWCTAWATEALRVLKPGGHMLAFGGTRTSHRLACAIEDAGFEIRDRILHLSGGGDAAESLGPELAWMYGSGFPKSLDVGKAIDKAARGVPQGGVDPTSPTTASIEPRRRRASDGMAILGKATERVEAAS